MGVSGTVANAMLVEAGFDHLENGTFVDVKGRDVMLDSNFAIKTSRQFKASYEFQVKYADNVLSTYDGNMTQAVQAYSEDTLRNGFMGNMLSDVVVASKMLDGLYRFAAAYDKGIAEYSSKAPTSDNDPLFAQIAADFDAGNYTDNNKLYEFINSSINPVVGENVRLLTKSIYDPNDKELIRIGKAGMKHTNDPNSLAFDLGTRGQGLPVVTTQIETLLTNNSTGSTPGGGYNVTSFTDLFMKSYKHLQGTSQAYKTLMSTNSNGRIAGVFRYNLPAGYQIGNVGTSGFLGSYWTGAHLHGQYTRR